MAPKRRCARRRPPAVRARRRARSVLLPPRDRCRMHEKSPADPLRITGLRASRTYGSRSRTATRAYVGSRTRKVASPCAVRPSSRAPSCRENRQRTDCEPRSRPFDGDPRHPRPGGAPRSRQPGGEPPRPKSGGASRFPPPGCGSLAPTPAHVRHSPPYALMRAPTRYLPARRRSSVSHATGASRLPTLPTQSRSNQQSRMADGYMTRSRSRLVSSRIRRVGACCCSTRHTLDEHPGTDLGISEAVARTK